MAYAFRAGGPLSDEAAGIAYSSYLAEASRHAFWSPLSGENFGAYFRRRAEGMRCIECARDGRYAGFMLYALRETEDAVYCDIPVWGFGARGDRPEGTVARLFERAAETVVKSKTARFTAHIYAHDEEIQRLFHYMQFGTISEKCARAIAPIEFSREFRVREMPEAELRARWSEVWALLSQLIDCLRASPVFYPCNEFTEEVYRAFFLNGDTRVFVAERDRRLIGLIEANGEAPELPLSPAPCLNVGEAYVLPEYRGTRAAQALLSYLDGALLKSGVPLEWLEHGTANPLARGFWNRYFETYEYVLTRSVEPVPVS